MQCVYWPGQSCTVRYRVRARTTSGEELWLSLCALNRNRPRSVLPPPPDFARRFGIEEPVEDLGDTLVWAYPYDPVLMGLPDAAHGPTVRAASELPAPAVFSPSLLRYRPTRRAVIRYVVLRGGGVRETLFGKVLREHAVRRTFDAYRSFARAGIALARPEAFDGLPGLALFPPVPGRSLRDILVDEARLPSARRLVRMIERLAAIHWKGEPKPRHAARTVRSAGGLLAHLLPGRRSEIEATAAALVERTARLSARPTVHGDLYDAQIFVGERNSIGLIDLEGAGPGDPLLDAANLLAHLAALSASVRRAGKRPLAYRALLRDELLERAGCAEADLVWREALCAFLLATGPFRVQLPDWPRRVEARVDRAMRLLERAPVAA
ncbi:MAG: phosphotransferase [Actinomycetota bacterium]